MKRNIAYILGVMLLAASCISEQGLDVNSTRNDEVNFVADMKNAVTRTLYGADNATTIKVKWVNGDQIKVFGTNCAVSTGEYQITEAANQPNVDGSAEESKADALVRMGEVGVQWGSEKTSDFVAVYPAENASFQYNSTSGVVTATTSISSTQNYVFNDALVTKKDKNGNDIKVWEGTHFANDATNPSMQNAIMYARTDDVSAGSNVSLLFEPYSTVLKFRFEGFESLWSTDAEVYIQNIVITAPQGYNIAGDFDLTIPRNSEVSATPVKATAKENATSSNSITINTIKAGGSFLKVKANEAVEFNVFTVPLSGLTMLETNPWTVTINVQGMDPLVYKMLPTKDGGYTLVPGLIHKVKVPKMVSNKVPEWNPENWITQIPPPVYVSELSVPGAWYAGDLANYQNNATLTALYNNGVRAFHIDCRLSMPSRDNYTDGDSNTSKLRLVCAGTDKLSGTLNSTYNQGNLVLSALQEIANNVKDNEYIVVVLSIAEQRFQNFTGLGSFGYTEVFGTINPDYVIPAITKMIDENGESLRIFGYYDNEEKKIKTKGKTLTKDTVVEDVLGTMVVKINTNTDALSSYTFPTSALVSFASMASDTDHNTTSDKITDLSYDYFAKMQSSSIQWGNAASDLKYYYHHAQKTRINNNASATANNPIPTLRDRKAAIDDIIAKSKSIYDAAEHNIWFQMGVGGYNESSATDKNSVSNELNTYLQQKIEAKMDTDPSPVGIVLMNNCLSYTDLIQDIIEMNGKFYLNRRGNDVTTGGGTSAQELSTKAAAAYVGPDAF